MRRWRLGRLSSRAAPGSSARATSATSSARRDGTGSRSSTSSPTPATRPTCAGPRRSRAGRPPPLRPRATSPTPRSSRPLVAEADAVVNFAAESHVDRSILDPEAFLRTGGDRRPRPARGRARATAPHRPRFLQVSTDEVYGSVEDGHSREDDPLRRARPYAAAKAAGELLVRAYVVTHGLDAVVTRGSNTYGPYHHPEKLIPLFVTNAIDDQPLPLYGDGLQRRDWLYVADHAGAIDFVLATAQRRDLQHPGRRRDGEPRHVRLLLELARQALVAGPPRRGPARARPALRDGRLQARGPRLAAARRRSRRASPRPSTGSSPTSDWWRAARSGDWDAYYERQYGSRLRSAGLMRVAVTGAAAARAAAGRGAR